MRAAFALRTYNEAAYVSALNTVAADPLNVAIGAMAVAVAAGLALRTVRAIRRRLAR